MKSTEKLQQSYERQKRIFEEKETIRQNNLKGELEKVVEKISRLEKRKSDLELEIRNEKRFESFESFRDRAQSQSEKSKE